ncbi:MAG: hypothetical protein ACOX0Y_11430 [Thiopseudomonas sp.]
MALVLPVLPVLAAKRLLAVLVLCLVQFFLATVLVGTYLFTLPVTVLIVMLALLASSLHCLLITIKCHKLLGVQQIAQLVMVPLVSSLHFSTIGVASLLALPVHFLALFVLLSPVSIALFLKLQTLFVIQAQFLHPVLVVFLPLSV